MGATERQTAVGSTKIITRATTNTSSAGNGTDWILLGITAIASKPILAPFHHITCHVIKVQFIGKLEPTVMRLIIRIFYIPCHVINDIATSIYVSLAMVTATSGKLPFSLSRHTEIQARYHIQTCDKPLAIIPRHRLNRLIQVISITCRRTVFAGIVAHHGIPQVLRHLAVADII